MGLLAVNIAILISFLPTILSTLIVLSFELLKKIPTLDKIRIICKV